MNLRAENSVPFPVADVPDLPIQRFRNAVIGAVKEGARLVAFFGRPLEKQVQLLAVLAAPGESGLAVLSARAGDRYPALTPACPQAHWFEREIAEQWGVVPEGHPWLKPIRFHRPWRRSGPGPWPEADGAPPVPGVTGHFRVRGDDIHEVAVGPVHAGVIEPGHFRFQCHGEVVHHLEISLGYQHRGIERALPGGPGVSTMSVMETACGDTTAGHAVAYAQALEGLAGCRVPPRALAIRGIALELERIANHVGDLGALAGDVGFLPTASFCGRIRGDVLNLTALLCGSRFGRGLIRPGGTGFDLDAPLTAELAEKLGPAASSAADATGLLWTTASVTARFENTGRVAPETCAEIGLVGPAARACGLERDVRQDMPSGIYRFVHIPTATWDTGDVFARAQVRDLEIARSFAFLAEQLETLPPGGVRAAVGPLAPDRMIVSLVEGWRGEICHVALTGADGRFDRYKIVDPSFHNWFGLACALRGAPISDFPLCNKSFNLSYCGHDL